MNRTGPLTPEEAKTAEEIWGAPVSARVAVCDDPDTFVIRKTEVNVRADGTVPKASASESTSPLATAVDVPACTALPATTEK